MTQDPHAARPKTPRALAPEPRPLQVAPPSPTSPREPAAFLEVPVADSKAFPFTYVRVQLTQRQGKALRAVHDALLQRGAQLADGHYVDGPHDVVRWVLEKIAGEMGLPPDQAAGRGAG